MSDDANELREKANELLLECFDEKSIRGSPDTALEKAKKAFKLTEGMAELAPWHRLAAYRWAHLLMRQKDPDLVQIGDLFGVAAGGEHNTALGASAGIYILAALYRKLHTAGGKGECDDLSEKIEKAFETAKERVQNFLLKKAPVDGAHQDGLFNLLELAGYFLGKGYEGLEGWGFVDPLTPQQSQAWVLLGDPIRSAIRSDQGFAMDQLEAIEKEHPKAVSLKFDGLVNKWYLGSAAVPRQYREMKDDQAEFLAFVLRHPACRRREMCSRLFFGKDHSLRQTMTRVSKFIRPDGPTVFVTASDPIKFVSGFSIYAAVPARIFSRRSP